MINLNLNPGRRKYLNLVVKMSPIRLPPIKTTYNKRKNIAYKH